MKKVYNSLYTCYNEFQCFAFFQHLKMFCKLQPSGNGLAGLQFIIPIGTKFGAIGRQPSIRRGWPKPRARLVLRSRAMRSGLSLS
jgi:hypothetical protein